MSKVGHATCIQASQGNCLNIEQAERGRAKCGLVGLALAGLDWLADGLHSMRLSHSRRQYFECRRCRRRSHLKPSDDFSCLGFQQALVLCYNYLHIVSVRI